jgi:hypothetical protein
MTRTQEPPAQVVAAPAHDITRTLAHRFVRFLETGTHEDLFADDVFCDFTMPLWRLQAKGVDDVVALRRHGHPSKGIVPRSRYDATDSGFVLEVEETWTDEAGPWYCRELFRADVREDRIAELSVYCTGDWDSAQVQLLRP